MNIHLRTIMYVYDLTEEAARGVLHEMMNLEMDFSECSESEYVWATNYAYDKWRRKGLAKQRETLFMEAV